MEIAVEPWIDTGHQGHMVSWNDVSDIFMKPAMQLWKWFLVPFKFPGILIIHSHSQRCFDDTFASCNLKGPDKPRGSSPSFSSLFPFLPNAITNSCHLCPQIPPFCTFLLMEEVLKSCQHRCCELAELALKTQKYNFPIYLEFVLMKIFNGVWTHLFKKTPKPTTCKSGPSACSVISRVLLLCDPRDCSLPGSSVHGIFKARVLERVAISFCRGYSWPRGWTCVSCICRWILYHWATWENLLTSMLLILPLIEIREHGNFLAKFQQKCLHHGYVGLK